MAIDGNDDDAGARLFYGCYGLIDDVNICNVNKKFSKPRQDETKFQKSHFTAFQKRF